MQTAGSCLAAVLVVLCLLFLRSEWEKRHLRAERYEVRTGKIRKAVRFLFLTDLHDAQFGKKNALLLQKIRELSPDAVLLGGDLITCGKHTPNPPRTSNALHVLEQLTALYPVYYGEGNHEARMARRFPDSYKIYIDHLMQLGVSYLRNGSAIFDTEDLLEDDADDLKLYAVSLEQRYFDALKPGFGRKMPMEDGYLARRLGRPEQGRFNILLIHSPLYLKEAAAWGADLVLSGHFHGGTIRLPGLGGLMTPQYQFFVKECAGCFCAAASEMIVSRGLGTHSIRIRLNDLPEITCIDIVPDAIKTDGG